MKKILLSFGFVCVMFAITAIAQDGEYKTTVNDKSAAQTLVGKHKLSLQWISWDYFGSATISNKRCRSGAETGDQISGRCYRLIGEQKGRGNSDYLKVNGRILSIDSNQFKFQGTIETQVSHINGGKPCIRSGDFTFKITGKRKYWRLMEMDNPCDPVTDYVDIYFR